MRNIQVWVSRYRCTATQHEWCEDTGQRLQSYRWEIYRCEHPGTDVQVHIMSDVKTLGRGYSHTGERYTGMNIQVQTYRYTALVMWKHWAEITVTQVRNIQVWTVNIQVQTYRYTAWVTWRHWAEVTVTQVRNIYSCTGMLINICKESTQVK